MNPKTNLQHIIFCPKYRRDVFKDDQINRSAERFIRHICHIKNIHLRAIAIQDDHVHILVSLHPTMSVANAAQLIKWYSSCHLRLKYKYLRTYPKKDAFWQRNYFAKSVGGGENTTQTYIENQMQRIAPRGD